MSDTVRLCPGFDCGSQLRDSYLCMKCQRKAERALGDLPALTRQLETTIMRLDRVSSGGKKAKGSEQPLPVNLTASERGRATLELLFEWTDFVAMWHGDKGLPVFAKYHPLTDLVPTAVAVLLRHGDWLRHNEQGPDLASAIHSVRRDLRRLIDQPPQRLYAGPCQADLDYPPELGYLCSLPLHRSWGKDDIMCDGHTLNVIPGAWTPTGCGHSHTAVERDEWMVAAVSEVFLPLKLLWASLHVLVPGSQIDWKQAQRWTKERTERITTPGQKRVRVLVIPPRLEPAQIAVDGTPLYRGSDVLRLARDDMPRRGRRRVQHAKVA